MARNKIIMYRTEMSNDSERSARDVMLFEITELGNTDILEYIKDNYDIPRILKGNIEDYIDLINGGQYNDEDIGDLSYMLGEILGCIEDETGKNIQYAYWLAEREAVEELYEGDEKTMYGYDISHAVILSDLGYDGMLFGFEMEQEPCEVIEPEDDDYEDDEELTDDDMEDPGFTEDEIDEISESFSIPFSRDELNFKPTGCSIITEKLVERIKKNH